MSITNINNKPKFRDIYRNRKLPSAFLLLLILFIFECSNIKKDAAPFENLLLERERYLVIWAHSDIQPRNMYERKDYEIAINDINKNIGNVYAAIVAGDIVQNSNSENLFKWYIQKKKETSIRNWYEIAGNHDQKDYLNYKKYINLPLHYSVRFGNILVLLMSDETKSAETNISDKAFRWWEKMVIGNQDCIIITVTHGYLEESGLLGTFINSRNIRNSKRFADVLRKYRVDIWLCGHTHLPHKIGGRVNISKELKGTLFINISAIRSDPFMNIESVVLFFEEKSDRVLIRSRDHKKGVYNTNLDITYKAGIKFQIDGTRPQIEECK